MNNNGYEDICYTSQKINFDKRMSIKKLPTTLQEARKLERQIFKLSNTEMFMKQAELLADYEDDYEYKGNPKSYFPSYQCFTNDELRGYFTWRTRIRKGEFTEASLNYILLLSYEIINQIGIETPESGYTLLFEMRKNYGKIHIALESYLRKWLPDYIIYYNLSPELLDEFEEFQFDRACSILDNITEIDDDKLVDAIRQLGAKWLARSKFYRDHTFAMEEIMVKTIRRMAEHYSGCAYSLAEQFFGRKYSLRFHPFEGAIFSYPLKRTNYKYIPYAGTLFGCKRTLWTAKRRYLAPNSLRKFLRLIKSIDSAMRLQNNYGHPVKSELNLKWLNKILIEEIEAQKSRRMRENAAKVKNAMPPLDLSVLDKIRADANETQEMLATEDELESAGLDIANSAPAASNSADPADLPPSALLNDAERKLLSSLLFGATLDWIKAEGHILSVLVDGINEKLYEIFGDSVIGEDYSLVEEYLDDLKELI